MANEINKNEDKLAGSTKGAQRSLANTKESLKVNGDLNTLLKESENILKKMSASYENIEGRLESLNKSSINIKQINQEILKARQKEVVVAKKLEETAKKIDANNNDGVKNYLDSLKFISEAREEDRDLLEEIAKEQFKSLNVEEQRYINLIEANKLNEQSVSYAKAKLESEEEINSSIGITGKVMGIIGKKLGANNDIYEDMVENARELNKVGSKLTFGDKLKFLAKSIGSGLIQIFSDPLTSIPAIAGLAVGAYKMVSAGLDKVGGAAAKAGNFMAGMSEDSGTIVRDLASNISDLARNIPLVGGLIGGLVDGFAALLDLVLGVDNMIVKTGRQLNLSAEGARKLYRNFGDISQAQGDIFMNGKKYLESQLELTKQLGTTNILSAEILRTNIKLKDFAGLEESTRAEIAKSATITGEASENTVQAILGQVVGLEKATGVSFQYQDVLKEVSSLGGYLGLQFAKYPKELSKSFLVTKTLGLELKKLDGMASGFLDFESSIAKEFEAQLLTGKEINLTKAREAFLNNDLAGAAAEIAKYTGDAAGYSKMNRIQQDSLAEALGMSRDEMGDMLKQQEQYSKFGATNRKQLLEQVDLLRKGGKEQEAIAKAGGEAAYNDLVRASAQEKLALFIEKIKQSIVEFVEKTNIIDKIENFVNMLSNPGTIKGIIGTIKNVIASFIEIAGNLIADVVEGVGWLKNFFTSGKEGDLAEARAMQTAAGIRSGAATMSGNLRGTGIEYKGEEIGTNAATSQTAGAGAAAAAASTSMAKPQNVQFNVTTYVKDTKKDATARMDISPNSDVQTGKGN
jgi:uncharacterized protein YoxC